MILVVLIGDKFFILSSLNSMISTSQFSALFNVSKILVILSSSIDPHTSVIIVKPL